MSKMLVSDPVKFALMLKYCVGSWYFETERPMTRIEFRLGRTALKSFEIDSMEDLKPKESALTDWLTSQWFRILKEPKVRGHENRQELHEIWKNVRNTFAKCFPGPERNAMAVQWKRRESLTCDVSALLKQAAGCLATAIALTFGSPASENQTAEFVMRLLDPYLHQLREKTREKAEYQKSMKKMNIGTS